VPLTIVVRRPWPVLCALGVAVLVLHGLALLALGPAWLDPDGPQGVGPTMQVRSVVPPTMPPTVPAPATAAAAQPTAAIPAERRSRPHAGATPAPATVIVAKERRPEAAPEQGPFVEPVAESPGSAVSVPVYTTRLPAAGRWRYRLQRGLVAGDAELQWSRLPDERYELRLEGRVAGVTLLDWVSQGQIDAAGVAPERFAVRRRGRDRQAANFQRDAGKITFSGPTHELPLLPGAQDRLSWLLQLPAIVAAAPERFVAGASVMLFVAGARGDGDVWTFSVEGMETVGDRPTLKLLREPRKPYDTRAEIWLDPAESYVPLRVLQTPSGGGTALDLLREREAR
jgi:hypothetical protein